LLIPGDRVDFFVSGELRDQDVAFGDAAQTPMSPVPRFTVPLVPHLPGEFSGIAEDELHGLHPPSELRQAEEPRELSQDQQE
jgi:hypothetical protein